MAVITDPRAFPLSGKAAGLREAALHAWAEQSLSAATAPDREVARANLVEAFAEAIRRGDMTEVESALGAAPSPAIVRQLLRTLASAWRESGRNRDAGLIPHGFALPVVVVAAGTTELELPAVLDDTRPVVELLIAHGALGGNRAFGLANALGGTDAVGPGALPVWHAWRSIADAGAALREVRPALLHVAANQEGAHLAFLIGSALAAQDAALFGEHGVGAWGMPLAKELSRQLGATGAQVLALPRAPADPVTADQLGRAAQREVALQLFASNTIRRLRADFGEPAAVISAHRGDGAGELRVSLSSPFGERDAEGFRHPIFAFERVDEALGPVVDLLRACRVTDIRVMAGVHPDRDPATGLPLFFRADAVGPGDSVPYH